MTARAYVENDVLSQDGMELVCVLYAKALERIREAKAHLEARNIKRRATAIGAAMAIIVELQSALDLREGGELARTLAELYAYVQQRLIEANASQSIEPLDEADRLLRTLYEGWSEARGATLTADIAPIEDSAGEQVLSALTPSEHSWTL